MPHCLFLYLFCVSLFFISDSNSECLSRPVHRKPSPWQYPPRQGLNNALPEIPLPRSLPLPRCSSTASPSQPQHLQAGALGEAALGDIANSHGCHSCQFLPAARRVTLSLSAHSMTSSNIFIDAFIKICFID
jgi:hypothetical protein